MSVYIPPKKYSCWYIIKKKTNISNIFRRRSSLACTFFFFWWRIDNKKKMYYIEYLNVLYIRQITYFKFVEWNVKFLRKLSYNMNIVKKLRRYIVIMYILFTHICFVYFFFLTKSIMKKTNVFSFLLNIITYYGIQFSIHQNVYNFITIFTILIPNNKFINSYFYKWGKVLAYIYYIYLYIINKKNKNYNK